MSDLYYSVNLSNTRTLCIGPATIPEIDRAVLRRKQSDASSYYLYEMDASNLDTGIKILATFVSEDAAIRLGSLLTQRLGAAETETDLAMA